MPDETNIETTTAEEAAPAPVYNTGYQGVGLIGGVDVGVIAADSAPKSNTPNSNIDVPCKGCNGALAGPTEPVILGGWGMTDADIQRVYLADPANAEMVAIGEKLTEMNTLARAARSAAVTKETAEMEARGITILAF